MNYKFKVGDKVQIRRDFKPQEFPGTRYRAGDVRTSR